MNFLNMNSMKKINLQNEIIKEWSSGLYQSKLDVIAYFKNKYDDIPAQEIIEQIEYVLSNFGSK